MKKIFFLTLIIISVSAFSQSNLSNEFYFASGYNMPQDPSYFSEFWFNAFNLNLGYNYQLDEYFIIQAEIGVNTFLFDEIKYKKRLAEYFNIPGLDENFFIISGGLKQLYLFSLGAKIPFKEFSEKFYPYLLGGGGLINNQTNDLIISGYRLESETEITTHLYSGIGASYILSDKLTFFADGSYYYTFTKNEYNFTINNTKLPIGLFGSYEKRELSYLYFRFGVIYSLPN